jgi:hypothetical protein
MSALALVTPEAPVFVVVGHEHIENAPQVLLTIG